MRTLSSREVTQVHENKSGLQTRVKLIPVSKAFTLDQGFYLYFQACMGLFLEVCTFSKR